MHIRFSTAIGTPVIADQEEQLVGRLSGVLIHPDLGKIEGFYISSGSFFGAEHLFIATMSIVSWGMAIHIKSSEYVSPPEDILRIRTLLEDPRRVLSQSIITQERRRLGRCGDVQFDTKTFMLEWLFPARWFWLQAPIPVSDIIEITSSAIIVREPLRPHAEIEPKQESVNTILTDVLKPAKI